MKIERTDSSNADFQQLVKKLDQELADIDGEEHGFYAQYNKITHLNNCIVFYEDEEPIACGAFKPISETSMEIKRMYVIPALRNQGIATKVLMALEDWIKEMGYPKAVLETGKRQPDAIKLYTKNGYRVIENYGQYIGIENSVCFEKYL